MSRLSIVDCYNDEKGKGDENSIFNHQRLYHLGCDRQDS
jgi:hypothetical protein